MKGEIVVTKAYYVLARLPADPREADFYLAAAQNQIERKPPSDVFKPGRQDTIDEVVRRLPRAPHEAMEVLAVVRDIIERVTRPYLRGISLRGKSRSTASAAASSSLRKRPGRPSSSPK